MFASSLSEVIDDAFADMLRLIGLIESIEADGPTRITEAGGVTGLFCLTGEGP